MQGQEYHLDLEEPSCSATADSDSEITLHPRLTPAVATKSENEDLLTCIYLVKLGYFCSSRLPALHPVSISFAKQSGT